MISQLTRTAQSGKPLAVSQLAPYAALLIDFDNVTMGIRSDISKELKNLFNSDIIKGKVAVQRAYADWRRYPQYVVPLAEASVDLIFAPAYGSSKKNATDIRLAIDALELVFTRSEIGTFILLSGDSDFSSLVLKLKEYGKYVVGVGIRESASDLLVQNCDEYYSYSALTGLTRAGDEQTMAGADPWELVERAVHRMVANGDVMRSDRLKQVILEMDANFDEKTLGFSKFNRFVMEAANRDLLKLQKLENGQYEIAILGADEADSRKADRTPRRGRRGRDRDGEARRGRAPEATVEAPVAEPESKPAPEPETTPATAESLHLAYDLLRRAAAELGADEETAVRDSDVKRRMLDHDAEWDESNVGFNKFSRFLRHAHDAEVINLRKVDSGNYEVALPAGAMPAAAASAAVPETESKTDDRSVGARRGSKGRPSREAAPAVLVGQAVVSPPPASARADGAGGAGSLDDLDLPTSRDEIVQYLTKAYKGIGRKTAETFVDEIGAASVFGTLHGAPDRVTALIGGKRGETLLEAWRDDYAARMINRKQDADGGERKRGRRGGRRRGGRGRKKTAPTGD
ncbi:MAG TPA: NYN domain-containing protein [Longimicrobiales bacterium]|nr:NYN domain-containing protein [Longimicrobiales bacterium]